MAAMFFSCIDRGIINLLVEPVKATYGLNDTQFGALQSLAFGVFYISMAIPLGLLSDRYQRRLVIAVGIAIFNVSSLMTGFSRNYTQLFAARVGVGFGEASLAPAAYSMITDYFPRHRLGRAMSMFSTSTYVGSSMALIIGGALVTAYDRMFAADPSALFGLRPWQATIISIAIPGLLLSPFFLLLREPARRGTSGAKPAVSFAEMKQQMAGRGTVLALLIAGSSAASLMIQAVSLWLPALFIRVYGLNVGQIGLWMGLLLLGGGVLGTLLGGSLVDRYTARGKSDGPVTAIALAYTVVAVFGIVAPLMPNATLALICFTPVFLLCPITFGIVPSLLQMMTPNQLRARVSAAYLTVINLVGLAAGPILVGFMTDYVFGAATDVRYSIAVITAIAAPSTVLFMLLARRPYRQLMEAAQ